MATAFPFLHTQTGFLAMRRQIYIRTGILVGLLLLITGFQYALSNDGTVLRRYIQFIYYPLQKGRSLLFNPIPVSIGDILYLLLILFFILLLIRLVYFLTTYKRNKNDFWIELLRCFTFPAVVYLAFLLLWGGNYARPGLTAHWSLGKLHWDAAALVHLNQTLIKKLNDTSYVQIKFPDLDIVNKEALQYYHQQYNHPIAPLKVKPTSLGYLLNYLGIQGYYNPLSGEAQFNRFIPAFMHPFVVAHEMAHQTGIAAEDDANLMAYILCVESNNPAFQYSGYLNLFLYAFADLKEKNNEIAEQLLNGLNPNTMSDIEELKSMRRKYRSRFRGGATALYDEYLRFHGQREGIRTYGQVTRWVYFWEQSQKLRVNVTINP